MIKYRRHLEGVVRTEIAELTRDEYICLDKNEAPFSPLMNKGFKKKIQNINARTYPDSSQLYDSLSSYIGVPKDQILLTFGSEHGIRTCYELMVSEGDEVIYLSPTFAMIDVFNKIFGAHGVEVSVNALGGFSVNRLLSLISAKSRLIVLPNPNNPTGQVITLADLEKIAKKALKYGALFLVDEAYYHYCTITAQILIDKYENIIIARTFSKAWGLAGIRVGYLLGQAGTIKLLYKLKPIDEVTTFSLHACLYALKRPYVLKKNITQVKAWQKKFKKLNGKNINYINTEANFILLKVNPALKNDIVKWFLNSKILIKSNFGHSKFDKFIRFSISENHIMQKILKYLLKANKIILDNTTVRLNIE